MKKCSEDALCEIFADAVRDRPGFASWILDRTKFAPHAAEARLLDAEQMSIRPRKRWWRHWWCHVPELAKDRETDIFMVFEAPEPVGRFALHVENKLGTYRFSEGQAQGYAPRGKHMLNQAKFLSHREFATVLIAPIAFADRYKPDCDLFDAFISHEELSEFLPEFAGE